MATRQAPTSDGWTLRRAPGARSGPRRGTTATAAPSGIPQEFLQAPGVRVDEVLEAVPADGPARRAAPGDLVLDVDVAAGEASLIVARHPSGALTFHPSTERAAPPISSGARRRGTAAPAGVERFHVPVRRGVAAQSRRGLVSKGIEIVVVKVGKGAVDKVASFALPRLAALWEQRTWSKRGLKEGWFRVSRTTGKKPEIRLTPGMPEPGNRSLLLLHGTFSNAASAFHGLAATTFFEQVQPIYGDRIYAYNHFSISRTPAENVEQMLSALPGGERTVDAVVHSRGGLVLRNLFERGRPADRLRLGHAVLVAVPNDGTPLATPDRWKDTVGWLSNLLELFPDNPFTTGAGFVAEAIVWLASHAAGDLPGLRAMDSAGDLVAELQSPPGPPADVYSALVSNFHPTEQIFQRALDVGVDGFFGTANDLVVPSEGGWRIDRDGMTHVPGPRIGCYGPGGNIPLAADRLVHHVNFFQQRETADFIVRALSGKPQGLALIDPGAPLPDRRFARSTRAAGTDSAGADLASTASAGTELAGTAATVPGATTAAARAAEPGPSAAPNASRTAAAKAQDDVDTFHIIVMDDFDPDEAKDAKLRGKKKRATTSRFARVLATYGGARVTTLMRLRAEGKEPKTLFFDIINTHDRIAAYTNREQGSLPTDDEMITFGGQLFDTLFQGDVRRLYDEARSRQRGRKLDLVLTSMIPWIAEKPWEFAYDTGRKSFLATEEIHFIRNVLTNVPADPIVRRDGPLQILVASAQPVGFGQLSIEQETEVVRRGFEPLREAGLVEIEVLARATPAALHGYLSTGRFDVAHIIGHGEFDGQEGRLLFEDSRGGAFSLGERLVREIFCQRGLSLVFLNACQSGTGGGADFNKGVAQSLVAHGLPALVANQYSVLDSSATSFAQHFYWSLAQGMTLGAAARESRVAVNYSLQGELIDWAVPVLYARDANCTLVNRPAERSLVPATSVRRSSRRAILRHDLRIAAWDIDDVFPALATTLERMNAAQSTFGFELVDMSVPLDVWDLESEPGTPYLWAEKLARRLQSKTVELRVDLLACVTRHWMRDNDTLNLFGWWPDARAQPVVIFSCAGIEMKAEGPETDRAIANALVSALTGYFGELGSHHGGARNCPLYFNAERDLRYIVGQQKFDAGCRRKVRGKLAKELPALEALLAVFR